MTSGATTHMEFRDQAGHRIDIVEIWNGARHVATLHANASGCIIAAEDLTEPQTVTLHPAGLILQVALDRPAQTRT